MFGNEVMDMFLPAKIYVREAGNAEYEKFQNHLIMKQIFQLLNKTIIEG